MKTSQLAALVVGLGLCVLFISGNAFSDGSATDMKTKKMDSAMITDSSSVNKPAAEEMKNTMKPKMKKPMADGMEKPMKTDMEKPMAAGMEKPMKSDMEKPMLNDAKKME
ncbi:MAG: hypothetical protein HKP41_20095 [Desulfobacterales bacterium]|nr:hypothetical protein [Desulfobacterales bacterium]